MTLSFWFRYHVVKLVAVFLIIFTVIPAGFVGFGYFFPLLEVCFVFYWCLYRPDTMPTWFLCMLGLFRDAISGLPLGTMPLSLLLVQNLTLRWRETLPNSSFARIYVCFAFALIGVLAVHWVVMSFMNDMIMPVGHAFLQWLVTLLVYLPIHVVCNSIYPAVPVEPSDVK